MSSAGQGLGPDLSDELQLTLRLMICDRDTALSTVERALAHNPALRLDPELPPHAAFPSDRSIDLEVVALDRGFGLRLGQMPALLIADPDDPEHTGAQGEIDEAQCMQARWLSSALERRERALRRVGEVLLVSFAAYFAGRSPDIEPIPLEALARATGLQPPSAERVIAHKRILTPRGPHELTDFVGDRPNAVEPG